MFAIIHIFDGIPVFITKNNETLLFDVLTEAEHWVNDNTIRGFGKNIIFDVKNMVTL